MSEMMVILLSAITAIIAVYTIPITKIIAEELRDYKIEELKEKIEKERVLNAIKRYPLNFLSSSKDEIKEAKEGLREKFIQNQDHEIINALAEASKHFDILLKEKRGM